MTDDEKFCRCCGVPLPLDDSGQHRLGICILCVAESVHQPKVRRIPMPRYRPPEPEGSEADQPPSLT